MFKSPISRLTAISIVGVLLTILTIELALLTPYLGEGYKAGDRLQHSAGEITLTDLHVLPEPGELFAFAELDQFYIYQDELIAIAQKPFTWIHDKQSTQVVPRETEVSDLSFLFWMQVFVGVGALIISGWIWAIRPNDLATGLFALSGAAVCFSALPSAIYTTRSLAIPSSIFFPLEFVNMFGAGLFGIFVLGLFLIYPTRLRFWKPIFIFQALLIILWMPLALFQVLPEWMNVNLLLLLAMLAICVATGVQFFVTKKDPKARASLSWLGLSFILGAGGFIVFNTVPLLLKMTPLHQGYAFGFFLIIYLGLAAGLTQYRLFEVGRWAYQIFFYAAGAVFFVLLDIALVYLLGMDRMPALGFSLLAIGFTYLPLRDYLWRFFSKKKSLPSSEILSSALHVAFAPSATERSQRWYSLLQKMFSPLELELSKDIVQEVSLSQDGLILFVPPVASSGALRISFPWAGASLFSLESKALASQLVNFIRQAESNRESYDRGVSEERRRMAQDLHDDVGARLLTGLYEADEKLRPTLQGAIADIRSIVSGMTGEKVPLHQLWADLRHETNQRATVAKIELLWPVVEDSLEHIILDYHQHKTISSILREAVSNVIRHSQASTLEIRLTADLACLNIAVIDNGQGISQGILEGGGSGRGLRSFKKRVGDIGGDVQIQSNPGKTQIFLTIPI